MSSGGNRVQFWNRLLAAAELIESLHCKESGQLDPTQIREQIREQLETISEAFGDGADPVENFEEYVVIKFCLALDAALGSNVP
ncbi:MAG: hypothetical protein Q7T44_08190 [Parvibaculum sp.]|nr:hypothetical protein [Parvibaculum sp.]MDO9318686.1 hypothetical protein [Gammaproteobacteria bacterium]